jgi:type IV secretory pathway VirB10-like protein
VIRPSRGKDATPESRTDDFELRAAPRPVRRLDTRLLLVAALSVAIGLAAAVLIALRPPQFTPLSEPAATVATGHQQAADGLDRLPKDYASVAAPPVPSPATTPRPSPAEQACCNAADLLAEREEKERLARLVSQARESPLFVKVTAGSERHVLPPMQSAAQNEARQAFAGAPLADAAALPRSFAIEDRYQRFLTRRDWPHGADAKLQPPPSPYTLLAGTVIAASLLTGLDSDLPGLVIAQVTENVYDSVSGTSLLVPQGARLIGKYDSAVAYGQHRALVVWTRLILPTGASIEIDNLPASDPAGYAGIADEVDAHTLDLVKGIGLATILGLATQNGFAGNKGESELLKYLRQAGQQSANAAGQHLIERDLDRPPTIRVRPGYPLRVIVARDLVLPPQLRPE